MTTFKTGVLAALAASRDMEEPLLGACDDAPPAEPGRWTARDHLAHIAHYRDHAARILDAVRTGQTPPADAEDDLEARNAAIHADHHDRPAAEILQWARASHDDLVAAVERCSEEELLLPREEGSDVELWRMVPGTAWAHVGQHVVQWHAEHGDAEAAERAALRVRDIDLAHLDEPRHRAQTTYNLGCYYALAGRDDDALSLVQQALALDPALVEWSREDPDLDGIRDRLPAPGG
jgi:Protein of unknown function (DUF1706)